MSCKCARPHQISIVPDQSTAVVGAPPKHLRVVAYPSTPFIRSVSVKNMLGDIQTDYANL